MNPDHDVHVSVYTLRKWRATASPEDKTDKSVVENTTPSEYQLKQSTWVYSIYLNARHNVDLIISDVDKICVFAPFYAGWHMKTRFIPSI